MGRETVILRTSTAPQLVAKESEFYRSCMLFTMLTTANHWSLFRARWNQSTHPHDIYCNIHQHLSIKSDLHFWHSLVQVCILLVSCPCHKPQLSHALWFFALIIKILIMQSPKASYCFLVIVIVIVIYFTFQRSIIGNKTLGYGTSHNTCNSYIHNTTYNCFIKIKLVIKRALVVKYYIEVQK